MVYSSLVIYRYAIAVKSTAKSGLELNESLRGAAGLNFNLRS